MSKEPTPEELVAELDAQYQDDKHFAESQADQALLSMHQYNKACSRLQTELEMTTKTIPLEEMEEAGVSVGRIASAHKDLTVAIKKLQELTRETQDHILDVFHEPYPTLDPDPFRLYRNEWSQRKRTEQQQELRRLEGVVMADNTSLDMIFGKIQKLLVEQYGQAFVDATTREVSANMYTWPSNDNELVDDHLDSLDEQSAKAEKVPTEPSPFQLGLPLKGKLSSEANNEAPTPKAGAFTLPSKASKEAKTEGKGDSREGESKPMSLLEQFKFLAGRK